MATGHIMTREIKSSSQSMMEFGNPDDATMVAGLIPPPPLASVSQQLYVSELLSPSQLNVSTRNRSFFVLIMSEFIAAADALLSIREQVSAVDKHLESMINEIPKLTSGCTEFIDSINFGEEEAKSDFTSKS